MAKKKASSNTLVLENDVGIEQAEKIKTQLLDSIEKHKTTLVDMAKVTDIDTSIIQVILSAQLEAQNQQKEFFVVDSVPYDVRVLLDLLGIKFPIKTEENNV